MPIYSHYRWEDQVYSATNQYMPLNISMIGPIKILVTEIYAEIHDIAISFKLSTSTACLFDIMFRRYLSIIIATHLRGESSIASRSSLFEYLVIDSLVTLRLAMKYKET